MWALVVAMVWRTETVDARGGGGGLYNCYGRVRIETGGREQLVIVECRSNSNISNN